MIYSYIPRGVRADCSGGPQQRRRSKEAGQGLLGVALGLAQSRLDFQATLGMARGEDGWIEGGGD